MFAPRRRGMHHRREGLGLLLLLHQLYRMGFDRIPPVTLATVAANVLIYLRVLNPYIKSFIRSPAIGSVCVSAAHVWYRGDWPRLVLAAWFHLDEWHLYYNMASFLWKGVTLERRLGSPRFAYVILVFAALTNALLVGLSVAAAELLEDGAHLVSCAAGFSGVIFALKVLTTYYTPAHSQRVMGLFSVPSRWACWVELLLIQVLVPRASFVGHLAGILVGLAYVKGPLGVVMDAVWHLLMSVFGGVLTNGGGGGRFEPRRDTTGFRGNGAPRNANSYPGRGYATRAAASSARSEPSQEWASWRDTGTGSGSRSGGATPSPTLPGYQADAYTGGLSEEEQMRVAMENSRADGARNPDGYRDTRPAPSAPPYTEDEHTQRLYPDLSSEGAAPRPPPYPHNGGISDEELRRRRLAHLNR